MELQFEIATKKEAIWRTAFLKEWCEKAGVCLTPFLTPKSFFELLYILLIFYKN